jgi:glycosyltransferase involved in cell wall biosynthesis
MISVCIPTYNGEQYIRQQLDSILCQLSEYDEIIISDDSSTDGTIEIIESYHDSRILLLRHGSFKSPIFNLENALTCAKGDFIFLADQDDVWMGDKIIITIEKLREYDIVVCNGSIVDDNLRVIRESYFAWKGSGPGFFKNLKKNSYLGCSLAFNKKILKAILPFPKYIAMHDIWIGLLSEAIGSTYFLEEKLFYYRRHSGNFTAAIQKSDDNLSEFTLFYKIWYRTIILYYIFLRYLKIKFSI